MSYTEGYHGTDELTARRIFEHGFNADVSDELYLAAPYQTWLAHDHGVKNAERTGSENYAILTATFPETWPQSNRLGPESIRFYGDDINTVAIRSLSVYTKNGELLEGGHIEVTDEY